MKKLYIKTNTAVIVYIAIFAVLLIALFGFGISGYLRSIQQPAVIDTALLGKINNTSGQIVGISGNVVTVRALDVAAPQPDYGAVLPGAALPASPMKTIEVYMGSGARVIRETGKVVDPNIPPEQVSTDIGMWETIPLSDLKTGDWVNVSADTDIKGLNTFDASEIVLLESPDASLNP